MIWFCDNRGGLGPFFFFFFLNADIQSDIQSFSVLILLNLSDISDTMSDTFIDYLQLWVDSIEDVSHFILSLLKFL